MIAEKLPLPALTSFLLTGVASCANWSFGDLRARFQSLNGFHFIVYHPEDGVIGKGSSMYCSLESENCLALIIKKMNHNYNDLKQADESLSSFSSIIETSTEMGLLAHSLPITKIDEESYSRYLELVKAALRM